ncbi:MAG TPA: hypothetical protein VH720_06265 [Candidatus Limnocylindrales bacterium]|jgi:hypothetical protein
MTPGRRRFVAILLALLGLGLFATQLPGGVPQWALGLAMLAPFAVAAWGVLAETRWGALLALVLAVAGTLGAGYMALEANGGRGGLAPVLFGADGFWSWGEVFISAALFTLGSAATLIAILGARRSRPA